MNAELELIIERPGGGERRVVLTPGRIWRIGRDPLCDVVIEGDRQISRRHVEAEIRSHQLSVKRLPDASNAVFFAGGEVTDCLVGVGGHFVLGGTIFTVGSTQPESGSSPSSRPMEEFTFSAESLAQVQYRDADRRIDVLSRLPDLIRGAQSEMERQTRLVNLLLAGVTRAEMAGLVTVDSTGRPRLLQWSRRRETAGEIHISHRLVQVALSDRKQSVLHVWERDRPSDDFTATLEFDWAICTPIEGTPGETTGLYLAGLFEPVSAGSGVADGGALRADVKFADLVAEIVGAVGRLRALEYRQAGLRQFLPPSVLAAIGEDFDPDLLIPRECQVTVMFCDLRGFSRHAESARDDLTGLLERVSQALGLMTSCISRHGGVIGDFQGDAAMGFWGWPVAADDDPLQACRAALDIRREFALVANTPGHPLANFRIGIGIAHGNAVAGRIGTGEHFVFTAFGPVANLASRLEGMVRPLRVPIIVDEALTRVVKGKLPTTQGRLRRLARVQPFGLETPTLVSELLPAEGAGSDLNAAHLAAYEQAVDLFIAGRWDAAYTALRALPAEDEAQDFLAMHITQHNRVAPADWNGVVKLHEK